MMLKEVLQKKFEYGGVDFNEKYIFFKKNGTTVCKANIDDFIIVEEYHNEGDFSFNWVDDILLIRKHQYGDDYEEENVHVYSLTEHKEIICGNLDIFNSYNYEDYFFVQGDRCLYRYDKKSCEVTKIDFEHDLIYFCIRKGNLFVCRDFHNVYIYEMKDDKMNVIHRIEMDEIFHEAEIQRRLCSSYSSSDMRLYKVEPYGDDLILSASEGVARVTMDGNVVWKVFAYGGTMVIIGHYGYESMNMGFFRIDLDNGELNLYDYNGELPPLSINGHEIRPSGDWLTIHNGLLWRMLYDGGLTLLAAIDPETGKFKYFHRFYDIAYENCRPKFINGKLYLYDAITKTLHVLEEVEGEPEKTFCGVPMSETELELVDTTKKVNNKKPAPTYDDGDIPLFEEIKQVAHIEHACVLDAECIDSLEDYSSLIVDILSLADVRKFTIIEHSLSGSISLKKGRKKVEFTPDGSDYIDSDAMLKALNEFLPICGAKGKIFSLWTPNMLQAQMFFYTEDTEAVENYSAENLQTDEAVDFEDMKGEIKW